MLNTGIVSNCWNFYLQNNVGLRDLIGHAADLEMRDIELRQGSMGDLEPTHHDPHLHELKAIAQAHHHCRFDYAMSFPFFSGSFDSSACELQLGRDVALACGNGDAHLRLVDVISDNDMAEANLTKTVESLVQVADDLDDDGIRLTIEHSFQTWDIFWPVFQEARQRSQTGNLWLCFDPANLSLSREAERMMEIVDMIDKSEISMLHVKQANSGVIETELCDGDVPWPRVVQEFLKSGYHGPIMFEFTSSPEVERVTAESLYQWQTWLQGQGGFEL